MKTILCWCRLKTSTKRQSVAGVGQFVESPHPHVIVEAVLIEPGLTWIDEETPYIVSALVCRHYSKDSPIYDVREGDVIKIELLEFTGNPLSAKEKEWHYFPYRSNFVALQKQSNKEDCTLDQLQRPGVLPPSDGWFPVFSSNILAVKYLNSALAVRYRNGAEYAYSGVSKALHKEFMQAPSKGTFINQHIKPGHQVTLLTAAN